ncbi:hypothetical protein HPB49_023130 [Dermacentor silvarum]|uniref:Uncharacterized protein n=1 Tax=Dermacentor silvarum TaxID=543639 RepID=A0ACB8C5X9_DERSI|nr:hypothetical protein HPB49_023130 [Dermacentor silvarum]
MDPSPNHVVGRRSHVNADGPEGENIRRHSDQIKPRVGEHDLDDGACDPKRQEATAIPQPLPVHHAHSRVSELATATDIADRRLQPDCIVFRVIAILHRLFRRVPIGRARVYASLLPLCPTRCDSLGVKVAEPLCRLRCLCRLRSETAFQELTDRTGAAATQLKKTRSGRPKNPPRSYRSSSMEGGRSPEELLQGRPLRTPLPDFNEVPRTAVLKHRQAQPKLRCLPPLSTGQVVPVRGSTWETKAKDLNTTQPRSYSVVTEKGNVPRRNRQHLLKTSEAFDNTEDSSDAESCSDEGPNHLQSTMACAASETESPGPRRSTRNRRPPQRLGYEGNFVANNAPEITSSSSRCGR